MPWDHWHDWGWGSPIGVFSFILLIILLNGVFGVLRARSRDSVIREAIRNGQTIDPDVLSEISKDATGDGEGGSITAGLIVMAVALGLVFMGWQFERAGVDDDEQIFDVMIGVAAIPFFVGVALFITGIGKALTGKKKG